MTNEPIAAGYPPAGVDAPGTVGPAAAAGPPLPAPPTDELDVPASPVAAGTRAGVPGGLRAPAVAR